MNIPKIPMYMYCHMSRSKKHGGSTYFDTQESLFAAHPELLQKANELYGESK